MKKRILLLTIAVLLGLLSRATGFTVNGVAYTITDAANKTVSIGNGSSPAIDQNTSGAFTIPGQVSNGTETYTVTSIGVYCFYSCTGLTSVTIPNSVTSIGDYAFYRCQGLTSVTIPNSVTSIGEYAFYVCVGLTSITIPNSVTSIGGRTFYLCFGLTSFNVDSNNPNYDSADGVLFNKNRTTLIQYPLGNTNASYTIPNSVTSIGDMAFSQCPGLTSITIPNSVTSIGNTAFSNCTGLTSITIPNSVTSIGDAAFSDCTGLTSVTIPNSVTSIGVNAFSDCTGLTSVTIPNSITHIRAAVFSKCTGLTSVTIPNSITHIWDEAFSNCTGLISVAIPNSVIYIGREAFSNCTGLTSIYEKNKNPDNIILGPFALSTIPPTTCTLYVPKNSKSLYEKANQWKEFTHIEEENIVPLANAGADQTVDEGTTVTLNGSDSSDADGDALSYQWTAPTGITLSSGTASITTFDTPDLTSDQSYTFSLTVSDGTDTSTDQVTINVKKINMAPVANAGSDQSVDKGTFVKLNGVRSSDGDGDPLSYQWTAPTGITLSSATSASPTFTAPNVTNDTPYTFTLEVSDGTATSTDQVVVTVIANNPPYAYAGEDKTVNEGDVVTLDGSESSDPEGSSLDYYWVAPKGITLNSTTIAQPSFTAPQVTTDTKYLFLLSVNDGTTESDNFGMVYITVKSVNHLPVADAGSNQLVKEGSVVSLNGGTSTDTDGDQLTYAWIAPDGITLDSASASITTFTAPEVTTDTPYTFSLVVNDGTDSSTIDQVVVTVSQVNKAPVANAGQAITVAGWRSVALDGSASSDPDNDALTYLWTAPAEIVLSSATVANPTFEAPNVATQTTYTFALVVSDGSLSSPAATVTITVTPVSTVVDWYDTSASLNIYPNPFDGPVNIDWDGNINGKGILQVYSVAGSLISKLELTNPNTVSDFSGLTPGVYLLRVTINGETITRKVVKK